MFFLGHGCKMKGSISTFSVGLDEVLGKNLQEIQTENQNADTKENDPDDDPAITNRYDRGN